MTRRAFTTHPLVVREVEVRRIQEVTPRMRRITVGGERLGAFESEGLTHPAFTAPGFDDHVKLIFASDGDIAAALPQQLPHGIEWGASTGRVARDYTPRAIRQTDAGLEVDLDFVMHGDGPAAAWAATAAVGDPLWFVGPKSSTVLPEELDWILLAGDETALPAIGRYLDERPSAAPVRIVLTVADGSAVQDLRVREDDRVEWVLGPATALEPAVRRALADVVGTGYVWAGSESAALLPVRRFVQRELGMAKSHINITGYWHADDPHETTSAPAEPSATAVPVASPLGWFAVRAALQLGLVDALAAEPGCSGERLAELADVTPASLAPLLPVLRTHGVIRGEEEALELGTFGDLLVDDDHERGEFIGLEADALLALDQLAPAMRAGISPWSARQGTSLATEADIDAETYAALVEEADTLAYLLDGFVADARWAAVGRAAFTGPGSIVALEALRAVHPRLAVEVRESTVGIRVLHAAHGHGTDVDWATSGSADVVVGVLALAHRTDDEAVTLLAAMRDSADQAVIIEASRPDGLGPGADDEALLRFAQTGAAPRDTTALGALAAASGWSIERVDPLGWGVEATWLRSV